MALCRKELVAWVGSQILIHEADVRAWLRRMIPASHDIDDVVQEAYSRIVALDDITRIRNGRAYFFRAARNIALERLRRARVVRIDALEDVDSLAIADEAPSSERILAGRQELQRVQRLIAGLPAPCRQIFELRRVHGVPQRQIAQRLGISENTVEMQAVRGLKLILGALAGERGTSGAVRGARNERSEGFGPRRKSGLRVGPED